MSDVLIPLADGCEELEAVTVIDLLRRAELEVVVASLDGAAVTASRGVRLGVEMSLDEALQRDYRMVVLPGGADGARRLEEDERIFNLLRQRGANDAWTAAICAAPKVLARAGLLEGREATSFPGFLDEYRDELKAYREDPVVVDGRILTSRGPGTAMDFALTLIETLTNREQRDTVEARLQRPEMAKA